MFSVLRVQSPARLAPSVYNEHAEPLRREMSLSGASSASLGGEYALRYGLSLKERLSGLCGRRDNTYAMSVAVMSSTQCEGVCGDWKQHGINTTASNDDE